MYSQAGSTQVTTSTLTSRERRPDLKLAKSPRWSNTYSLEQSYPSPPMSDTPNSPRRSSLYPETTASTSYPRSYPTSETHPRGYPPAIPITTMEGPMLPMAAVYQQSPYGHDPRNYYPPPPRSDMHQRPMATQSHYPPQPYESYLPPAPPMMAANQQLMPAGPTYQQGRAEPPFQQGPTSLSSSSAPRSQRTTRRTKAHVAKACQNCKKAHLSCDEARPCARCVASGKQATCVDVEHKKRGRPRLRDDREQRLEQAAAAAAAASQAAPSPSISGPSPARGHRRGDSLRVLRSQAYGSGSDDSRPGTSQGVEPPRAFAHSTSYPSPYPASRPPPAQLSAFLNLDLHFLKVSEPLRALLGGNHDITDRPLREYVTTQFESALQRIQNELRDERARREPTYLPAIYPDQQERAAVRDHEPENAESLSGDFLDRSDVYAFRIANRQTEQFQVRIRLARTSTFFATMILYRFAVSQAAIAPSPFSRGSQYGLPDPSSPARSPYHGPNPGSPFATMPNALMTTLPPPTSIPPPSSHPSPYIYGTPPGSEPQSGYFSRVPAMHPPPPPQSYPQQSTGGASQRSRSGTGEALHLPPIVRSAPTTPTAAYIQSGGTLQTPAGSSSYRRSSDGERGTDDEEDGRKRRRLNIQDIVEK